MSFSLGIKDPNVVQDCWTWHWEVHQRARGGNQAIERGVTVKKSPVIEVRDLLQEDEYGFPNTQEERIPQNTIPSPITSNSINIPAPNSLGQRAIRENRFLQAVAQQSSSTVPNINSAANTQPTQVAFNVPTIPTFQLIQYGPLRQTASRESQCSVLVQQNSAIVRNTIPTANTQSGAVFRLKWVPGTRISRCYGCNKEIKNPLIHHLMT